MTCRSGLREFSKKLKAASCWQQRPGHLRVDGTGLKSKGHGEPRAKALLPPSASLSSVYQFCSHKATTQQEVLPGLPDSIEELEKSFWSGESCCTHRKKEAAEACVCLRSPNHGQLLKKQVMTNLDLFWLSPLVLLIGWWLSETCWRTSSGFRQRVLSEQKCKPHQSS